MLNSIIAPQAQFQSVGLGTKAPDDVRVEFFLSFFLVHGGVLLDELVRETPAVDFFKI